MKILMGTAIGGEISLDKVIVKGMMIKSLVFLLFLLRFLSCFFFFFVKIDLVFLFHSQ